MTTIFMTRKFFEELYANTKTDLSKEQWIKKLNIKFLEEGVKNA